MNILNKIFNLISKKQPKIQTCTCSGVNEAAAYHYQKMINAGASYKIAQKQAYQILNGEWIHCKCKVSKNRG